VKRRYNKITNTFEPTKDEVEIINQVVAKDEVMKLLLYKLDRIITLVEGKQ